MPCCSKAGPAYKQRVELVFTSTASTAATPALSAQADAGAVTKLLYYANVNNDKLPHIARELERRIGKELTKKRFAFAVIGAFALNELLRSCHRDLRLFYAPVAATIRALLSCMASRDIQLVGVDLFATFAGLPSRVLPTPGDADAFVRDLVRLASAADDDPNGAASTTAGHQARLAGLRGIRAYLPLLDEQPSRLNEDAPRILPSIFANLRFAAPPVPYPRTPLAPKDDDDDDGGDGGADKAAASASDPDDSDDSSDGGSPSVRRLARQCLRELAVRTSTTNVKALVEAALDFTDAQALWTAPDGAEFTRELFGSICGTLKPHDYQTALDALLAKVTAVADLPLKTRVVDTLRATLRGGMLTIHQLVRTLLQQLVDSLKLVFAAPKDAALHAKHSELHRALLAALAELGNVVEQSKRWDLLSGVVRQLKALPGIFTKPAQCAAANALLVHAFARVAAHLKPLTAADASQLAAAYDALLAVAVAPAAGDERVACAVATVDAMRALVAAAPPRTDDDDDRAGLRFAANNAAPPASAGAGADGAGGGAASSEADPKKRIAERRGRRGTGGPRDLAAGLAAAPYVERHARIMTALDAMLFPGGDETPALCSLVSAAGSLLLAALAKYGVGEALRTLPFIFSLQQRAADMPDDAAAAAAADKPKKKSGSKVKSGGGGGVVAAAGVAADATTSDASAVHVLVGAYLAALAEKLDNDELRATVTHTLSQRSKKKQRSVFVSVSGAALVFDAAAKKSPTAKRITTTFERAGVVSVLLRDKIQESFEQLAARLSLEWERSAAAAAAASALPSAVSRFNSAQAPSRTSTNNPATNSGLKSYASSGDVEMATSAALAPPASQTYPHNAPVVTQTPAQALADASISASAFLAVLRGDLTLDDDDNLASEAGDEHSDFGHASAAGDEDDDEDDDDGMQVSDSDSRSEISVDDDDNDDADAKKARKAKAGKNGAKPSKKNSRKQVSLLLQSSSATGAKTCDVGSEKWFEQVAKLRERSFDEVAAVSARAHERALRETSVAAFNFDASAEGAAAFVDDDVADPIVPQHNWHIATTLPILLDKLATLSGAGDRAPHLRDEFAVGALVAH